MAPAVRLGTSVGLALAASHAAAALWVVWYVAHSADGQAPLMWGLFLWPDLPLSLIYYLPAVSSYAEWVEALGETHLWLAWVLYVPHLLHGVLGTIWWFFLPRFFLPRRLGGVWGRKLQPAR